MMKMNLNLKLNTAKKTQVHLRLSKFWAQRSSSNTFYMDTVMRTTLLFLHMKNINRRAPIKVSIANTKQKELQHNRDAVLFP